MSLIAEKFAEIEPSQTLAITAAAKKMREEGEDVAGFGCRHRFHSSSLGTPALHGSGRTEHDRLRHGPTVHGGVRATGSEGATRLAVEEIRHRARDLWQRNPKMVVGLGDPRHGAQ